MDGSLLASTTLRLRLHELRQTGCTVNLFSLTDDFPVLGCFCVLESPIYPHLSFGAAVKADFSAACAKAIDEAVSSFVVARYWQRQGKSPAKVPEAVTELEDHALYYAGGDHREAFDFLLGHDRAVSFDALASECESSPVPENWAELRVFAESLRTIHGWDVLWADVTAEEVREHGYVAKVVVPQMVPLSRDHNVSYLATRRLSAHRPKEGFNRHPHPFA